MENMPPQSLTRRALKLSDTSGTSPTLFPASFTPVSSGYAAPRELSLDDGKASRDSPKVREFRLETALVDEGQPDSTGTSSGGGKRKLICQILGLAIPALASMSVDYLMSAVDTAYIGRLSPDLGGGKVGLGALGLNTTVFYFIFFIFDFLATVPTPLVASARAEGDFARAANLVGQLLTLALIIGTLLTLLLEFYGSALLHLMGSTSLNESEALLFLRTRALAAPAVLLIVVGNGAYRGFLDTKTPFFIAVGAQLINFVLDPILIFKLRLGIRGAAIATVIAEWTGALVFLLLLGLKDPAIRPRMISLPKTREGWEQGRAVVTSSVSAFGGTLSLMIIVTMAGALAARAGPASIAAHQVAMLLWLLFGFVGRSLAVTAQGLIADRIGTDAPLEARRVASLTQLLGEGWGITLLVIFLVGRNVLPLIFTPDKEVLEALAPIFVVVGVMQPINSFVYVGEGILEGCKDFVYEAVTRALGAMLGAGYMIFCASFKTEITLLDAWIGLLILQGSRATTFSYRHWLDPLGPLVLRRYPEDLDEFDVKVVRE